MDTSASPARGDEERERKQTSRVNHGIRAGAYEHWEVDASSELFDSDRLPLQNRSHPLACRPLNSALMHTCMQDEGERTKGEPAALERRHVAGPHLEPPLPANEVPHRPVPEEEAVVRPRGLFQLLRAAIHHALPDFYKLVKKEKEGQQPNAEEERRKRTPARESAVSCSDEGDMKVELLNRSGKRRRRMYAIAVFGPVAVVRDRLQARQRSLAHPS